MANNTTIASVQDIITLGRPISKNIDQSVIEAYIREAEDLYVKPAIGQALYIDVLNNSSNYTDLLNGCTYNGDCPNGERRHIGLLTTIAYYTQGLLTRYNNIQTTRFRAVEKVTEYGSSPQEVSLNAQYNNIMGVADTYLNEVLDYLKSGAVPMYNQCDRGSVRPRLQVKIIG